MSERYTGHVDAANRLLRWNIHGDGGTHIDEQAVALVDRMVASLISISNGWCADPRGVAERALYGGGDAAP